MKRVMIWSVGIGAAVALFVGVLLATGPGHHDLVYNADVLLALVGVVLMHLNLRRHGGARLTYLRALGTGAVACVVAGVLSRLTYFLYLGFIDDSLFGMITDQWRKHLTSQGLDPAEIEQRLGALDFSAWSFASSNLIAFLLPALVLTAIAAIFTRERRTAA